MSYDHKEAPQWLAVIGIILALMILTDISTSYMWVWSKRFPKMLNSYYQTMDRMDSAVIRFWGNNWRP